MDQQQAVTIFQKLNLPFRVTGLEPFLSEEDGGAYQVWKISTDSVPLVIKKVTDRERETYQAFFPQDCSGVPVVYGFADGCMVMEYIEGHTLSDASRSDLVLFLDTLIQMQEQHWENHSQSSAGYGFEVCCQNRMKRLPFMEDLKPCYEAYLDAFRTLPRTLCNDDLLPFNVMISGNRAVILDWELGGILPYPSALARLLAFGEEEEGALFRMSKTDRIFAVDYYYEHLIQRKGIRYEEYIQTMKLFFFKEYSEWIYCANSSGDFSGDYYKKYSVIARKLANELGYV